MNTKIVNIFGGPCVGKSTLAAELFVELKKRGYNAEQTNEYAKWLTYEKNYGKIKNQIYLFAKQQQQVYRLIGLVEYVIMDSPLIFSAIYDINQSEAFKNLILEEHNKFDNINILIRRETQYVNDGRYHTHEEAIEVDNKIRAFLEENNIPYIEYGLNELEEKLAHIITSGTNKNNTIEHE